MRNVLYYCLWLFLLVGCNEQQQEDELLWTYYDTFSFPPETMNALLEKAPNNETQLFIKGLRFLEQCDFDPTHNPRYLDSARACFEALKTNRPNDYKGHLGLGLTYTEYPDRDERYKDTTSNRQPIRDSVFNIAFAHYHKARQLRPDLVAIRYYWARALFYKNDRELSVAAIQKLDSVIREKTNFFKAHERAAQFLSHYSILSMASTKKDSIRNKLEEVVPDFAERVRYHFDMSLSRDSSWYETYEGIANARGIYPIYERVHYLEKAIRIAQRKKSIDTAKLIAMRWSIFVDELSNNDAVLEESEKKKTRDLAELSSVSKAYYYLHEYDGRQKFESIISDTKQKIKYDKQIPDFWVTMSESTEPDTVFNFFSKMVATKSPNQQATLAIELSKWYWTHGQTADAERALKAITDHKKLNIEVDDRLHGWLDFLQRWEKSGAEAKVAHY